MVTLEMLTSIFVPKILSVNLECPEDIRNTCKFKDKGINEILMISSIGKKGCHILKRKVTRDGPPFQNI